MPTRHPRHALLLNGIFLVAVCVRVLACPARVQGSDAPDAYPPIRPFRNGRNANIPPEEEIPIDLPTVLKLAGTDSLDVRFAEEQLIEANARRLSADMTFLPTITPQFEKRWQFGRVQSTTGQFQVAKNKQSALEGVEADLNLHLGEAVFAALAARRRVEASEAGLRTFTETARLQAVVAYFNLVLARADQAIVDDRLAQADETIRLARELRTNGKGLLSEEKRAEAARAEVEQRLASAKETVRNASLTLTGVLNIDPLVRLVPVQQPQDIFSLVPQKSLTELVSDAVALRPELAESRALWAALNKERKAAYIGPLIPTVTGEAGAGSFGPNPTSGRLTDEYAIGLNWKVGPGGIGDVSRTRIADSRLRQEDVRFAKITDQIMREVVSSQFHVETTKALIELAKKEIAAAEETLRLTQERLQTGTALTIEILSAQDALFFARSRAANYISEYNKAQYTLLRSIGGFHNVESLSQPKNGSNAVP